MVRFGAAVSVLAALGWACGGGSPAATVEPAPVAARAAAPAGPVVEQAPVATLPPLDPDADPATPLGELRARYLPVWSPDLDWAFPPEVCGSDWALDAVASPAADAAPAVLGDPLAAAALSVMRYEHLLGRAFAAPTPAAQLCVAVATVDPRRRAALESLAGLLRTGGRAAPAAAVPAEVRVVAASPGAVVAVACAAPGGSLDARSGTPDGPTDAPDARAGAPDGPDDAPDAPGDDRSGGEPAPVTLAAYLLELSRGLEDAAADVSYRVGEVAHRSAGACDELDAWAAGWRRRAQQWAAEGLLWSPVDRTVTAAELCDDPPPGGPDECPRDWRS